jgi:nitrogen fixation protein
MKMNLRRTNAKVAVTLVVVPKKDLVEVCLPVLLTIGLIDQQDHMRSIILGALHFSASFP